MDENLKLWHWKDERKGPQRPDQLYRGQMNVTIYLAWLIPGLVDSYGWWLSAMCYLQDEPEDGLITIQCPNIEQFATMNDL